MARTVVNIEEVSKAFDIRPLLDAVSLGVSEGFCRGLSCTTPDHVDADYKSNPVVPAHSHSFSSYLTLSASQDWKKPAI